MEKMVFALRWGTGRVAKKDDEIYAYYENQKIAHEKMKEMKRMHNSIKFGIYPMRVVRMREYGDGRRYYALLKVDADAGWNRERVVEG